MQKFFILVIGVATAYLILRYRRQLKDLVGDIGFAERYLGSGGTNTLIVIIAVFTFVFTLMYVLGTLDSLLFNVFGRFFGASS
ncbi:hypothetical protein HON58_03145 [Candidatus Peregrinibacteria bacterium]|nr:hypothetical protein [Candidatus Peregrinibacteria bacterium]